MSGSQPRRSVLGIGGVMVVFVAACIAAIVLWVAARRGRLELVIGVALGLALAGLAYAVGPTVHLDPVPVWLPPLPFALVAITLFLFGGLAWWWGRDG